MARTPKTMLVIVWPDGLEERVLRGSQGYGWSTRSGSLAWSSHLHNLKQNVQEQGGSVERRPYIPSSGQASKSLSRSLNEAIWGR